MSTRLLGPEDGAKEVGIGDSVIPRHKDGTYHIDNPSVAHLMRKSGDFTVAGTRINGRGFVCTSCGFVALLSDSCGRCGGTELSPE